MGLVRREIASGFLLVPSGASQSSHESHSFEAGGEDELKIVQEFVRPKSREKRL